MSHNKSKRLRKCFYCKRMTRNKNVLEVVDRNTKQTVITCDNCWRGGE